jgi:hypothetical protein
MTHLSIATPSSRGENRGRRRPPLAGLPGAGREPHKARRRWPGMAANRDDDLKDSFYLYIMRSSIGAGLKSQYSPNGHMPDRLAKLMKELESPEDDGKEEEAGPEQSHGPARKQARKG